MQQLHAKSGGTARLLTIKRTPLKCGVRRDRHALEPAYISCRESIAPFAALIRILRSRFPSC